MQWDVVSVQGARLILPELVRQVCTVPERLKSLYTFYCEMPGIVVEEDIIKLFKNKCTLDTTR